jgi:hypothetical protein
MNEHPLPIEGEARTRGARTIGTPDWAGLMPVGIAALGPPSQPVQRLMGAQSAIYRLIVMLGGLRRGWASAPAAEAAVAQPDAPTRA